MLWFLTNNCQNSLKLLSWGSSWSQKWPGLYFPSKLSSSWAPVPLNILPLSQSGCRPRLGRSNIHHDYPIDTGTVLSFYRHSHSFSYHQNNFCVLHKYSHIGYHYHSNRNHCSRSLRVLMWGWRGAQWRISSFSCTGLLYENLTLVSTPVNLT